MKISNIKYAMKMILWVMLLHLWSLAESADFNIKLTSGTIKAIPILLPNFYNSHLLSSEDNLSEIIGSDLLLTEEFELINASQSTFDGHKIELEKAKQAGADYAIEGEVISSSFSGYRVKLLIYDLYNKEQVLLQKEFNVQKRDIRRLAHHMSNAIYKAITGKPGVFDTRIAYVNLMISPSGSSQYRLVVSDIDGHNTHALLTSREPLMSPAWSPDGKSIAYVSFENKQSEIYINDVYSGRRELVSSYRGINSAPAWSPDGKTLAVVLSKDGSPDIFLYHVANRQLVQMTKDGYINTEPTWSSDGQTIYFTSDREGSPQIFKMDVQSRLTKRITYQGSYNASPHLSPDGKRLFILHKASRGFDIAEIRLSDHSLRLLTQDGHVESFTTSPDGRIMLYTTNIGASKFLKILSFRGKIHKDFYALAGISKDPAWSYSTQS